MNNRDNWYPTKYVYASGKLKGSRNIKDLSISSRLVADAAAQPFDVYLGRHCSGKLIDLGCGTVPLYGIYKDFIDDSICVDWPKSMHGVSYLDFACDLSAQLPIQESVFDTIILSDVMEHIREPQLLWAEMNRISKIGGKLIISVPFLYRLHEEPHDYFRYTEHAIRHLAESHGFEMLILEPYGGIVEVLGDLSAKLSVRIPFVGAALARSLQTLVWGAVHTPTGYRISGGTARQFPLGYFGIAEKRA